MKKLVNTLFLMAFMFCFALNNAQSVKEDVEKTAQLLFEYSKLGKFAEASKIISYSGKDSVRAFNDSYNFSIKDEKQKVKRICKKIAALLRISDGYEFSNFKIENKKGMEFYILQVKFTSNNQVITNNLKFVKSKKGYLFVEIK